MIGLGVTGKLQRTLQSTNPCKSMISTVRAINRNVKNWSSGEMCLRWTDRRDARSRAPIPQDRGQPRTRPLAVTIEQDHANRRNKELATTLGA